MHVCVCVCLARLGFCSLLHVNDYHANDKKKVIKSFSSIHVFFLQSKFTETIYVYLLWLAFLVCIQRKKKKKQESACKWRVTMGARLNTVPQILFFFLFCVYTCEMRGRQWKKSSRERKICVIYRSAVRLHAFHGHLQAVFLFFLSGSTMHWLGGRSPPPSTGEALSSEERVRPWPRITPVSSTPPADSLSLFPIPFSFLFFGCLFACFLSCGSVRQ
jgi:hypothetical protein